MPCRWFTGEEGHGVARVQGRQNLGPPEDLDQAQGGDGGEPEQHDGAEDLADALGSLALEEKQAEEDAAGNGQDEGFGGAGGHIEPLHRREHRDDRGDDAVAIEQGGAEDAQDDETFHRSL